MDDLISRKVAIDEIKALYEWHDTVTEDRTIDHLKRLPSAQPTEASCWGCNCQKMERLKEQKTFSEMVHLHDAETHEERTETHACDYINRKDAIEAHYEYCNKHPDASFPVWSLKILEDLPSAQPFHNITMDDVLKFIDRMPEDVWQEFTACLECRGWELQRKTAKWCGSEFA